MAYVDALENERGASALNFVEVGNIENAINSLQAKESDLFMWDYALTVLAVLVVAFFVKYTCKGTCVS